MKKMVSRELVDAWNRIARAILGKQLYLCCEYNHNGNWNLSGYGFIRDKMKPVSDEIFYIRRIKDNWYLYWESTASKSQYRWKLSDIAKAYFGVE